MMGQIMMLFTISFGLNLLMLPGATATTQSRSPHSSEQHNFVLAKLMEKTSNSFPRHSMGNSREIVGRIDNKQKSSPGEAIDSSDTHENSARNKQKASSIKNIINYNSQLRQTHDGRSLQQQRDGIDECLAIKASEEDNSDIQCNCLTIDGQTTTLQCTDTSCLFCNSEEDVCATFSYGSLLDTQGNRLASFTQHDYTNGRSESIRLLLASDSCSVTVNGIPCTRCSLTTCNDGRGGIDLECLNVPDGSFLSTCDTSFSTNGVFQVLNPGEFDTCLPPVPTTVAEEACNLAQEAYEDSFGDDYLCACAGDKDDGDGTFILECKTNCQDFCDASTGICGEASVRQSFSADGQSMTLRYSFVEQESQEGVTIDFDGDNCTASALEAVCTSCSVRDCAGDVSSILSTAVDCQNVQQGLSFDSCDEFDTTIPRSPFDYFADRRRFSCGGGSMMPVQPTCSIAQEIQTNVAGVGILESSFVDGVTPCFSGNSQPGTWFRLVGTGTGLRVSTCGPETTFDASVSVYIGTCDQPRCVETTYSPCSETSFPTASASWFAENGVEYYLKVHGDESEGFFRLLVEPADLATEQCEIQIPSFELEPSSVETTDCNCQQLSDGDVTMLCDDTCEYCNMASNSCTNRTQTLLFDERGSLASISERFFNDVSQSVLELHRSNCTRSAICSSCEVFIGNDQCNDCQTVTCDDGEQGLMLDCANVIDGAAIMTCEEQSRDGLGLLDIILGRHTPVCPETSLNECLDFATMEMENNPGTLCDCRENQDGSTMECVEVGCLYCRSDSTVCASYAYSVDLDDAGIAETFIESFQYEVGRSELVQYEITADGQCTVSVNGDECNSCQLTTCIPLATVGYIINCTNLVDGTETLNTCTDAVANVPVFQHLDSQEYSECSAITDSAQERCSQELVEFERNNFGIVDCDCYERDQAGNYILECLFNDCVYCNPEITSCGYRLEAASFYNIIDRVERGNGFKYVEGRGDTVLYFEKEASVDMSTCRAEVNGDTCSSCQTESCLDISNDFEGYTIACDNIPGGSSFSLCDAIRDIDGVFEFESANVFDVCYEPKNAAQVCQDALESFESSVSESFGTTCECIEEPNGSYSLQCADRSCKYCNENESACAVRTSYGTNFNSVGISTGFRETYSYVSGLAGHVALIDGPAGCTIEVGGQKCQSCESVSCNNGGGGFVFGSYEIDCTNIAAGLSYSCQRGSPVFQALDDPSFQDCLPFDGTFPPTPSPQTPQPTFVRYPTPSPTPRPTSQPTRSPTSSPSSSPSRITDTSDDTMLPTTDEDQSSAPASSYRQYHLVIVIASTSAILGLVL